MKRVQKAFTLVELLVVIGIIAVLIAILLPSLQMARYQAAVVRCSATMHSVLQGVVMYANDNKGYLPPAHLQEGPAAGDAYFPAPRIPWGMADSESNFCYTESMCKSGIAITNPNEPGAMLGRLRKAKYLANTDQSYYCPSAKDTTGYQAVYYFNPHVKTTTASYAASTTNPLVFWWNRLPNYGKYNGGTYTNAGGTTGTIIQFKQAILTDPMYDYTNSTHAQGSKKTFNLGYPDGSVVAYTTTKLAQRSSGGSTTLDHWSRLEDFSNAVQYSADGGDVLWANQASWNNKFNFVPHNP